MIWFQFIGPYTPPVCVCGRANSVSMFLHILERFKKA